MLSERQSQILKAIIEEHIESAQPVGSVELVKRKHLPVSGATVRNIMSDLVRKGYLEMEHVSSGRVPSDRAYRYYITDLMVEDGITVLEEITLRQKIWSDRYEIERLLRNTVEALSDTTGTLAYALTNDGFITYTGASKILDMPEFYEIEVTKAVLKLLDDYELAKSIFEVDNMHSNVTILVGREIGLANLDTVSLITVKAYIAGKNCVIGIAAPSRNDYCKNIPIIRYLSSLLDEISQNL